MNAIICDRCELVIKEKTSDVLRLGYSSAKIGEWHHIHLCEKFRKALECFLNGSCTTENPGKPEKHAHWDNYDCCSACGQCVPPRGSKCPNCGAIMGPEPSGEGRL